MCVCVSVCVCACVCVTAGHWVGINVVCIDFRDENVYHVIKKQRHIQINSHDIFSFLDPPFLLFGSFWTHLLYLFVILDRSARVQMLPGVHTVHPGCSPMICRGECWRYEVTGVAIVPDGVHPSIQQVKKLVGVEITQAGGVSGFK